MVLGPGGVRAAVQDQMGAKYLQRALGEGPVFRIHPKRHFSPEVKVSPAFASAPLTLSWDCNSRAVASRLGGTLSRPLSGQLNSAKPASRNSRPRAMPGGRRSLPTPRGPGTAAHPSPATFRPDF